MLSIQRLNPAFLNKLTSLDKDWKRVSERVVNAVITSKL